MRCRRSMSSYTRNTLIVRLFMKNNLKHTHSCSLNQMLITFVGIHRSLRKDVPPVQWAKDSQEEDPCEETNSKSCFQ